MIVDIVTKAEQMSVPKSQSEDAGVLVVITDYDPATHRVSVVRADNRQPLRGDSWVANAPKQGKLFDYRLAKTLKISPEKEGPIVEVTEGVAAIRGSSKNGISSHQKYGNIIKGSLSLASQPHEIRLSGITTLNPLLTTGFPSTIITPMPTTIFSIPGAGIAGQMAKDVALMAGLIAAFGVV